MKILIVAEGRYPDFTGGAETVIRYLARELVNLDNEVYTLTRKPHKDVPDYEVDEGIYVYRYHSPPIGSLAYVLNPVYSIWWAHQYFVHLSTRVRFDAIIFNQPFPAMGILPLKLCKRIPKAYIFHSASHDELRMAMLSRGKLGKMFSGLIEPLVRYAEHYSISRCDVVITLSSFMKAQAIRYHGTRPEDVEIIPGGVDTDAFSHSDNAEDKQALRNQFGIAANDFVLFVAKRLYSQMGIENLIESLELLADRRVHLLIAGDGPLRSSLDELVKTKKLQNQVLFLGSVPYSKMVSYYQLSDLFISTRAEPFGLVMLEALACGLPVLSVPSGGAVEILQGLSADLFFDDMSSGAMADLIGKYLNHPHKLEDIRKKSRQYVLRNYSWSAMGARIAARLFQKKSHSEIRDVL